MTVTGPRTADTRAARRLALPNPDVWTVTEAREARECTGDCVGRVERRVRVVYVHGGCRAHTSRVTS